MKSRLFHIVLFLLLAQSAVAQRDIFNWQIMPQGGVFYFSDQIGDAKTPNAYGAGLRLMGNAGRSWQLGLSYLESRYWDDSNKGISLASISVGYAWDNGYLLRERAFLSPYHLLDVGYLSMYRPDEESPFKSSQGIVGLENGFKFRLGDRWSARLGLGLYWRADDQEFKNIFNNDFEYGYKAGFSFYFGQRKSNFQGPVFNAGREFEQRRTVMRLMEEQGVQDISALPFEAQLKIRTTPLIDTLTVQRPEKSIAERMDTTYVIRTDTLYLVDGDTLTEMPEKTARVIQLIENDSTVARGDSTFVRGDSTFVRRDSTFVRRDSTFVRGDSIFVRGDSFFVRGDSIFVRGDSIFVRGDSTFVRRDSTFVRGDSTFVKVYSTFVQEPPKAKADTLFTQRRDTVYTQIRDTISIVRTDTLYLFGGDTLSADSLSAALESFRQKEEAKLRKEEAERRAKRTDTVYVRERPIIQGGDTVVTYYRTEEVPRERPVTEEGKATENRQKSGAEPTDRKNIEYDTSDILRRQNELIETQNNLIRAMLQREYPEQNITIQQPDDDRKFKPRVEVVPQVAIPLGGENKKSKSEDDDLPTKAELLARINQLETEVQRLNPTPASETTEEKPYTYSRQYAGVAVVSTASDTTETTSAPTDTLTTQITPDTLDRSTMSDSVMAPQPVDDSLKVLKPDTASMNGAHKPSIENAKTDDKTTPLPTTKTTLRAKYPVVVLFGLNRTNFDAEYHPELDRIVADLSARPNLSAVLTGFTDASGQADYNLKLSNKRAESVKTYLVEQGIAPERVTIDALGQSEATKDYEQSERRVEITLQGE